MNYFQRGMVGVAVMSIILLIVLGAHISKNREASIREEYPTDVHEPTTVTEAYLNDIFVVEEEPVLIENDITSIGKVVVSRKSTDDLFATLVIPYRHIDKGTEVELVQIQYWHNNMRTLGMFTVIK